MTLSHLYRILLLTELAAAAVIFVLLFFISAPYGKFNRSGWGPGIRARTAWFIMELPAVLMMPLLFIGSGRPAGSLSFFFLVIWEIHYLYRTFAYPARIRGSQKTFPWLLAGLAFLFNLMNGSINGYGLFFEKSIEASSWAWTLDIRFISGLSLFFTGLFIHIQADETLRKLRADSHEKYRVPHGRLFRTISCPNYLGEIIEWFGWALLTWSWAGLAFAIFTVANLAPRARSNHRWYRKNLPDYPENRRALIPFLY